MVQFAGTVEHLATVISSMCREFCEIWSCSFLDIREERQTNRQTHRHANCNTTPIYRGEVGLNYWLSRTQDVGLRNELSVVVVLISVDILRSITTKLVQCFTVIIGVDRDKVTRCPHFDADQHQADAQWMIQLQQCNTGKDKRNRCQVI